MIRTALAAVATTAAVAALTIAPAEAAAYGVTLTASTAKADVNTTFKLSGKVTGKSAGGKKLVIQRKIGSAAWKNFSTVTTRSTGTYAKTLRMTSVGAKSFRVLAPKKGKLATGKSATKTVTGFTWLLFAKQSHEAVAIGGTGGGTVTAVDTDARINGKKYSHSLLFYVKEPNHAVGFVTNTANRCDRVAFGYALDDQSSDTALPQPVEAGSAKSSNPSDTGDSFVADNAPATTNLQTVNAPITAGNDALIMGRNGAEGTERGVVAITTPRIHCSITELPASTIGGTVFGS